MKHYTMIRLGAAAVAALAVPVSTFAATYGYINTSGRLESVTAADAHQALLLATDIDVHSGVIELMADSLLVNDLASRQNPLVVPVGNTTVPESSSSAVSLPASLNSSTSSAYAPVTPTPTPTASSVPSVATSTY